LAIIDYERIQISEFSHKGKAKLTKFLDGDFFLNSVEQVGGA